MDIPRKVIEAARGRKHLGGKLEVIGKYNRKDVYSYVYNIPMTIGMPELYLWDGNVVQVIEGEEALSIISSF
jgi:hypothetical protein